MTLRRVTAVMVACACTATLSARQGSGAGRASADLEDALVALERRSWQAWQKRDAGFFQTFLTEDHVEIGTGGVIGKAAVVAGVASPACVVKSYEIDRFTLTSLTADAAVLTYHAAQDTMCGQTAVPSPVWASSLYLRRDGRWMNAVYQQTPTTVK